MPASTSSMSSPNPISNTPIAYPHTTTTHLGNPSFICTVCWQPQHLPSAPKVLGASSRIVCHDCWKTILDLSICWVCGDCIVRGDEVVSLGWCFWHKECFGCLVCGTKLQLPAVKDLSEWGSAWDLWDGGGKGKQRQRRTGIELEMVPLCGVCESEADEGIGEKLGKGRDVGSLDGGVSPERLDMMTHEEDQRRRSRTRWHTSSRRFRGSSGMERDLTKFINGSGSHYHSGDEDSRSDQLYTKPANRFTEHLSRINSPHNHSDPDRTQSIQALEHESRNGHLSVLDPGFIPAFNPVRTRPLPKWMAFLPRNVDKPPSNFHPRSPSPQERGSYTVFPPMPTDKYGTRSPVETASSASAPMDIPDSNRRRTTISIDETKPTREYSISYTDRRHRSNSRTRSHSEVELPTRKRTPYPGEESPIQRDKRVTERPSTSCPEDLGETPLFITPPDRARPEYTYPPIVKAEKAHGAVSGTLAHSSEYLDKYHPKTAGCHFERYVPGKPEAILDKIRKGREGKKRETVRDEVEKEGRIEGPKLVKLAEEEFGLDPRREDLQRELRNLFCEE